MYVSEADEDRHEGAGWRDYLTGEPEPEPFAGKDGLLLSQRRHKLARHTWHQVLTWYMDNYGGDSVNSIAGYMGWFDLRLTRQETRDLFRSARGDARDPIEEIPGQSGAAGDALEW